MRTITVLRHSKACKATDAGYQADLTQRKLTGEGIEIALGRRDALGSPEFDLVLASPAVRTVETAQTVACISWPNKKQQKVRELAELCVADPQTSDDARRINELLDRLGYSPLTKYFEEEGGKELLFGWAKVAWQVVYEEYFAGGDERALVVGHAVLVNALGYVAVGENEEFRQKLAEANFGECEGYTLTFDDNGNVTNLEMLGKAPPREPLLGL